MSDDLQPAAKPRTITYVRPWLYAKQLAAIFTVMRYAIIEASTKAGKTFGCLVWLAEQAMKGKSGQNFWWVAPVFSQAKIAFRRLKRGLPSALYTANESEMTITLINGTIIWFKSGDNPDSLYGDDVHAAVVDEASRVKEDAWHAVRSTLTHTNGHVRIIGNVKGRRNWFHKLARRAEAGEPDMHYAKLTWRDAVEGGVMKATEVEDARRILPEQVFKELFDAKASDDEGNPFGIPSIHACISSGLSTRPAVAWGIDLAKSSDWTVAIGLDAEGMTCRLERWQGPWEITFTKILALVGRTRALVDSTGVGDPIVERLRTDGRRNFEGYTFTRPSKQKLMEGLAVAIQQQRVRYPEGVLTNELEAFEYEYTAHGVRYSAPAGIHDDCVCALALAVQISSIQPRRSGALII